MSVLFAACMFTCIALVALIVFPYAFTASMALMLKRGTATQRASHASTVAAACIEALFVLLFVLPTIANAEKWSLLAVLALLDFGFFLWALYLSSPARRLVERSLPTGMVWARCIAPVVARVAPQWHSK